ncbi:MAG: hypothetical protein SGARI_005921 [Bacillariaceae sp.]
MGCSLSSWNWTSFLRKDSSKVPALEAYFDRDASVRTAKTNSTSSTNNGSVKQSIRSQQMPKTIDELTAFGETLQTGDILIMHCTHTFGKIAQLFTLSTWDHVAMVVRLPTDDENALKARIALIQKSPQPVSETMPWPNPGEEGPVEIFEAMGGGAFSYPFTAHVITRGDFCKYSAVRRLTNKDGEPLDDDRKKKIEEFVQEFWARPYEQGRAGMFELARPMFHRSPAKKRHRLRDKKQEALDNLFCSELITEAMQAAELLPEDNLNSNEILPGMFAPGKAIDKYLADEDHGYALGEVEVFKAPQTPLHEAVTERRAKLQHKIKEEAGKDVLDEHLMKPQ